MLPPKLSRRSFLVGSGAAALLAACGGDDDGGAEPPSTSTTTTGPTASFILGTSFDPNGLLVAGIPQRAPFLLFEPSGGLVAIEDAPAELTFEFAADGNVALPSAVSVTRHGDDVDRAYYPLVTTFPAAGQLTATATVGGTTLEQALLVNDPADVAVPQVGAPLPPVATPTTAAPLGVQTVCTREPPCPFHEVSLDAALAAGQPVVLMVSTPAYCQVAICGPVLDVLIDAAPAHPDLAVVHLEVYPNGAPPGAPPSTIPGEAFGLTYEPVLFVADATGTVTARLDNIYDGAELEDALVSV